VGGFLGASGNYFIGAKLAVAGSVCSFSLFFFLASFRYALSLSFTSYLHFAAVVPFDQVTSLPFIFLF
jgi:hypothetical protein